MKLMAQQEYGLRCLLVLAKEPGGTFTIPVIAKREGLSEPYVAKLMRSLLKGGLVQSIRGQGGGYQLVGRPEEVPLSLVMNTLGGRFFSETFCKDHAGVKRLCVHNGDCSMRALWVILDSTVQGVLQKLSLKSLLCNEGQIRAWGKKEQGRHTSQPAPLPEST